MDTTPSPGRRRALSFDHLAEVMPEVDRLLPGHQTLGQWTLGQICNHLATTIRGSVEGYAVRMPWIVRRTVGPLVLRRICKTGRMPAGVKAPKALIPRPGLDARAEAEALRATLRIFDNFVGPIPEHPIFGRVTKDDLARIHCIHCAHHLSFVLPLSTPTNGPLDV